MDDIMGALSFGLAILLIVVVILRIYRDSSRWRTTVYALRLFSLMLGAILLMLFAIDNIKDGLIGLLIGGIIFGSIVAVPILWIYRDSDSWLATVIFVFFFLLLILGLPFLMLVKEAGNIEDALVALIVVALTLGTIWIGTNWIYRGSSRWRTTVYALGCSFFSFVFIVTIPLVVAPPDKEAAAGIMDAIMVALSVSLLLVGITWIDRSSSRWRTTVYALGCSFFVVTILFVLTGVLEIDVWGGGITFGVVALIYSLWFTQGRVTQG